MKKTIFISTSLLALIGLSACAPQPGPDKTLGSAAVGAAWGAGAGAVIGNQLSPNRQGEGVAVGAAFGLVEGALIGANADIIESAEMKQERELENLKIKNNANAQELFNLQAKLDLALSKAATSSKLISICSTASSTLPLFNPNKTCCFRPVSIRWFKSSSEIVCLPQSPPLFFVEQIKETLSFPL